MTDIFDELEDHQRSLGWEPEPKDEWWMWPGIIAWLIVAAPFYLMFLVICGGVMVVLRALEICAQAFHAAKRAFR